MAKRAVHGVAISCLAVFVSGLLLVVFFLWIVFSGMHSESDAFASTSSIQLRDLVNEQSADVLMERSLGFGELGRYTGWVSIWPNPRPGEELLERQSLYLERGIVRRQGQDAKGYRIGDPIGKYLKEGGALIAGATSGPGLMPLLEYLRRHPDASTHFSGAVSVAIGKLSP